jgi:hypothetical protein
MGIACNLKRYPKHASVPLDYWFIVVAIGICVIENKVKISAFWLSENYGLYYSLYCGDLNHQSCPQHALK